MANPIDLPVVIINGLGAPRALAVAYGSIFRARGMKVFVAPQIWLGYGDIREAARLVAEEVARVKSETGADKVRLVGMSLGGLIGLYYLKCAGGAPDVERFISVGGPLNGSTVARLAAWIPSEFINSLTQTSPESALMKAVQAAPVPAGVRLFSVGTRGDLLTPRSSWDADGCEPVQTRYGLFPVGHWMLFLHPGNHRVVAELLDKN